MTRAVAIKGEIVGTLPDPPEPNGPWSKELVSAIAMDIGKEVVAYIKVTYPKAVESTSSTFCLSLRNSIHNEIMAAIEVNDEGKIVARMKDRAKFRRWWVAVYKKIREKEDRNVQTITEAAVEMVAKAIFDADPDAPDCLGFDEVHYLVRDPYFAMARAAMKVIREMET